MTGIAQTVSSENPADNSSLEGLNNFFQDKIYLHLEKVIPGIVQSYDKTTNRATIKPAITGIATEGQKVPKDTLENIPVIQIGSLNGQITFPIKSGMTGWLIACDRDISIFKNIKAETAPNTPRKHKYQDSFFIPDSINSPGTDNLTISTEQTTFEFGKNIYSITAATINITGNTTQTGTLEATTLKATTGASGTFKSNDSPAKTITVVNGIITGIS